MTAYSGLRLSVAHRNVVSTNLVRSGVWLTECCDEEGEK